MITRESIKSQIIFYSKFAPKRIYELLKIASQDPNINPLVHAFPTKPVILNLLVNDVCNSRCQMCMVWKQKRDKEITSNELTSILRDPLFNKLQYVGVSGGEPTLREDLPELFRVLVQKKPRISGTGIITNAINADDVIARSLETAQICKKAEIAFNVMVSLDGIGEVHDRVRGRAGNFSSAMRVIRYFRDQSDIPVSIGCTITKDNVWHVDEVLDFCRDEGIYGRFRVAEFICRLHNEGQTEYIRNFTEFEAYQLALFFTKLEITYEQSPVIRRTYRNIRQMLVERGERSIGCPWQVNAVTLDSRGQLLYCAPKSPILGNTLEQPAQDIYYGNIPKRKEILEHYCSNCIHDYHASETIGEWWATRKEYHWQKRLALDNALLDARKQKIYAAKEQPADNERLFLVLGWYGTETAGDKAILGEIIHRIRSAHSKSKIVLASLCNPYYSRWTVKELGYPDVEVIPTYSAEFWEFAGEADEVVMGGGPLMHLEELGVVLQGFMRAKANKHRTWIAGCGIGPLNHGDKYKVAVKHILDLADVIELRDSASVDLARQMTGRTDIVNTGDPSVSFIKRWMEQKDKNSETPPFLNLYLRSWTAEYQGGLTAEQFQAIKAQFEDQLGACVKELCVEMGLRPRLIPMHHYCLGNDDRDFNRRFANKYLTTVDPVVEQKPISVQDVLQSMLEAKLCICMRFHSVVFANTLKVPFVAIDYTNGGKIAGYLADHESLEKMINVHDIANGKWRIFFDKYVRAKA